MKPNSFLSKEKIIIGLIIFLAIFFAKFPTIYNSLNTPKGYWYPKQTSWFDAWDVNFQVSYIRYGQRNGVLLENTYTTTPHNKAFIYQYYTFLGVINRLFDMDPFLLFHLSSVVTNTILLLVIYFIISLFFRDKIFQISTFILVTLGGGFGFTGLISPSSDINLAGFTPLYALERGHEALITILLLLCFAFLFKSAKDRKNLYLYWSVIFGFFCFTIHPPFALLVFIVEVIGCFWIYSQDHKKIVFLFPVLLVFAYLIYFISVYWKLLDNPGFAGVVGQNLFNIDTLSLVSGWGLSSVFIFYMLVFGENKAKETIFLKLLFLTQFILLLSPLGFHLYYAKNLYLWGVLLAVYGIIYIFPEYKNQMKVITILLVISLFSRVYIFNIMMHPNKNNSFLFLTGIEGKALEYMRQLPKDSGVLSLYRIGNYIPAHTDLRVYYGHNFQTPDTGEKKQLAMEFYTQMDEKQREEFVKQNNISYIYYGLEEALLRKNMKLTTENPFPEYKNLYKDNNIIVYSLE